MPDSRGGKLDTSPFDRISFYVSGGASGGQRIAVGAACSEKNVSDGIKLAALPAKKWVAVTIPLSQLGLEKKPDMTSFWIQGSDSRPQAAVYIPRAEKNLSYRSSRQAR